MVRIRTTSLIALPILAALVGLFAAGPVLAAPVSLTATLQGGAAEDPPGDPDGGGTAGITIDPDTREVCWDITVTNIADAVVSHIHVGAAGANGDVVVPLDTDGFAGTSSGCVTADAAADLQAILANPAGYYVNVHTADFPGGAVRGQLAAGTPNTALDRPTAGVAPLLLLGVALLLCGLTALRRNAARS
jgi:CHRD domain